MSTAPALTIAPMRPRHVPEVLAIEAQVYPRPWSERLFGDELARDGRAYVVARAADRVVGYAGILMIADDGHVATVAVDPAWQGQGIARHLLLAVVRRAIELGARQLTLEVRVSNEVAQALYRAFGFAPAGARKGYYADDGEDALVMWCHDVATPAYAARLDELEASSPLEVAHLPFEVAPAAATAAHPATTSREAS